MLSRLGCKRRCPRLCPPPLTPPRIGRTCGHGPHSLVPRWSSPNLLQEMGLDWSTRKPGAPKLGRHHRVAPRSERYPLVLSQAIHSLGHLIHGSMTIGLVIEGIIKTLAVR